MKILIGISCRGCVPNLVAIHCFKKSYSSLNLLKLQFLAQNITVSGDYILGPRPLS
jgi:hypothetical protein